jgi:hypothetical protein
MNMERLPSVGGTLSIALIFVFIYVGARTTGASPLSSSRTERATTIAVLGFCILLMFVIPILSPFLFLIVIAYGVLSGIQIMRRGEQTNRWFVGSFVITWIILGYFDFVTSVNGRVPSVYFNELSARGTLHGLVEAERDFASRINSSDSTSLRYGSLDELRKESSIDQALEERMLQRGYSFSELLGPEKNRYVFVAVPTRFPDPEPAWATYVPGLSLYYNFWRREETQGTGKESFAVDETGTIRVTGEQPRKPITPEQVAHWRPI